MLRRANKCCFETGIGASLLEGGHPTIRAMVERSASRLDTSSSMLSPCFRWKNSSKPGLTRRPSPPLPAPPPSLSSSVESLSSRSWRRARRRCRRRSRSSSGSRLSTTAATCAGVGFDAGRPVATCAASVMACACRRWTSWCTKRVCWRRASARACSASWRSERTCGGHIFNESCPACHTRRSAHGGGGRKGEITWLSCCAKTLMRSWCVATCTGRRPWCEGGAPCAVE